MHFYQFPLITFLYPWYEIGHKDIPYKPFAEQQTGLYIKISKDTWNRPETNSPLWEMGIGGK